MTTQKENNQEINVNTDYVRKVQAGILIPKRQHENFEHLKKEIAEIKEMIVKQFENK